MRAAFLSNDNNLSHMSGGLEKARKTEMIKSLV